jgi:hypothetical protein
MVDAARPAQDVFKKQAEEWFIRGHHDIETASCCMSKMDM